MNCNDWANLFKSLTFIFKQYETSLIKRIVKKFSDMKIKENNNVRASIFARAVFLLQEEQEQDSLGIQGLTAELKTTYGIKDSGNNQGKFIAL